MVEVLRFSGDPIVMDRRDLGLVVAAVILELWAWPGGGGAHQWWEVGFFSRCNEEVVNVWSSDGWSCP